MGKAFGAILQLKKNLPDCAGSVGSIETLIAKSPENLLGILVTEDLPLDVIVDVPALLETASGAGSITIPPTLTPALWEGWLKRLESKANVSLDPSARTHLAGQLSELLFEWLRPVLKDDFEAGGKAYAAFHMLCLGRLLDGMSTLLDTTKDILDQVNATAADVSSIKRAIERRAYNIEEAASSSLSGKDRRALSGILNEVLDQSKKLDTILTELTDIKTGVARANQSLKGIDSKLDSMSKSLDAFRIEATAIVNRYLDANLELSQTIRDREAEITKVASALRDAQAAADNGDALAKAALAEVSKTGDLKLLEQTTDRIADEQYAKAKQRRDAETQRFEEREAEYIERIRNVAALAYLHGDTDKTESRLKTILGLRPNDLNAINRLGLLYKLRGDLDPAKRLYLGLLELNLTDTGRAVVKCNLGVILRHRGDLSSAEACHTEALGIARTHGSLREEEANNLGNLGIIADLRRATLDAKRLYEEALAVARALPNEVLEATNLGNLGVVANRQGDYKLAKSRYEEALEIAKRLNHLALQAVSDRRGVVRTEVRSQDCLRFEPSENRSSHLCLPRRKPKAPRRDRVARPLRSRHARKNAALQRPRAVRPA